MIQVKGKYPKELMTLITEEFDNINQSYGVKLRVKKLIPCNCPTCQTAENANFYSFGDLRKRREKRKLTIECSISYDDVSVVGLLDGVFTEVLKNMQDYDIKYNPGIQTVELFLASSSEMEKDRRKFELLIARENKKLVPNNIYLHLNIWEDFLDSISLKGKQADYNAAVLKSKVFVSLFGTKVGPFTEEEFDVAYGGFIKNGNPKYIYTFFKNENVSTATMDVEALANLKRFEEDLKKLGHYPTRYKNWEDLLFQFKNQLDMILEELK